MEILCQIKNFFKEAILIRQYFSAHQMNFVEPHSWNPSGNDPERPQSVPPFSEKFFKVGGWKPFVVPGWSVADRALSRTIPEGSHF